MIMENVEGLIKGEAWSYVQRIYKELNDIGYKVKHWLLKGQHMGVPQTRHRVFFVAIPKENKFDLERLDMSFDYEPITYGEIKSGIGDEMNKKSVMYDLLCKSEPCDKRLSDTLIRLGEKEKFFNERICWEHNVVQTISCSSGMYRGTEKTRVSCEDIISASTFPQDYDFINRTTNNVKYICGMSVPPIMIKRIVTRLIEKGVFDECTG
jgi:DNA (cytosine-5)-methyltransferase 1